MKKIGSVVSEIWSDKVKSWGRIYSSRRVYSAKYGISNGTTATIRWSPIAGQSMIRASLVAGFTVYILGGLYSLTKNTVSPNFSMLHTRRVGNSRVIWVFALHQTKSPDQHRHGLLVTLQKSSITHISNIMISEYLRWVGRS